MCKPQKSFVLQKLSSDHLVIFGFQRTCSLVCTEKNSVQPFSSIIFNNIIDCNYYRSASVDNLEFRIPSHQSYVLLEYRIFGGGSQENETMYVGLVYVYGTTLDSPFRGNNAEDDELTDQTPTSNKKTLGDFCTKCFLGFRGFYSIVQTG